MLSHAELPLARQEEEKIRPPSLGKTQPQPRTSGSKSSGRPLVSSGLDGAALVVLKQDFKAAGEDDTSDDLMDRFLMASPAA